MSEQIEKSKQTWPASSPLYHVKRPTDYGDGKPSDVRDIGELPSRLLLGALDRDSFRLSPEGWRAVYRSGIPDTCCGISYDIPAREFTVDWAYRDVICHSGKVQGDAFTDIIKSTTRSAPARLLAELNRSLEGPLNVFVPQGAAEDCNFVFYPDGFLMAVACPVPVCRLAGLPDVMRDIDRDDRIAAYVNGSVRLRWSVVNYVEGLNQEPMTDPLSADVFTMKQTGLPPFEKAIWEAPQNGRRALTIRRRNYLLTITAFLGDIEIVISHLVRHGLISTGGDRESYACPDAHEFGGLVAPSSTLGRLRELSVFDDRKTRRLVVGRSTDKPRAHTPSDKEYDPRRYREFARAAEAATSDMYAELGLSLT